MELDRVEPDANRSEPQTDRVEPETVYSVRSYDRQ
jgi:hypothetical protein